MKKVLCIFILFTSFLAGKDVPPPISGNQINKQSITTADVLARARLLKSELLKLNWTMGKPEFVGKLLKVDKVTAREVYFQSLNVNMKCNHLQFELLGKKSQVFNTEAKVTELSSFDIYKVLNDSLSTVLAIKSSLNITTSLQESTVGANFSRTEVFKEVFVTSQLLNQLLSKPVSPSDVYMRVTEAIHISAKIIRAGNNSITSLPVEDEFVPGKKPKDVYRRLLNCFDIISQIANDKGMEIMTFTPTEEYINLVLPEDVYDLASIILSELSYLHLKTPKAEKPVPVYFPGLKFPSHVFQRVSILEKQLVTLSGGRNNGRK